eukprot:jgi/Mesvir1/11083/Mv09873-RA.1
MDLRVYGPSTPANGMSVPPDRPQGRTGSITLSPFLLGLTPITVATTPRVNAAGSTVNFTLNVVRLGPPTSVTARFNGWSYDEFIKDTAAQDHLRSDLAGSYNVLPDQVDILEYTRGSVVAKYTIGPRVNVTRDWLTANASDAETQQQNALIEAMALQLAQSIAATVAEVGTNLTVEVPGYRIVQPEVQAYEPPPALADNSEQAAESCPPCPNGLQLTVTPLGDGTWRCACALPYTPGGASDGMSTTVIIIVSVIGGVVVAAIAVAAILVMVRRHAGRIAPMSRSPVAVQPAAGSEPSTLRGQARSYPQVAMAEPDV